MNAIDISEITDNCPNPCQMAEDNSVKDAIGILLEKLPERQREIICRHFGLQGRTAQNYSEIARQIGISSSRVRTIETKALHGLEHPKGKNYRSHCSILWSLFWSYIA